jgi:hypothetical protein
VIGGKLTYKAVADAFGWQHVTPADAVKAML